MKKIIFFAILAAAGGYWLLLSKPALYYGNSLEYKCFTLRARGALPEGAGFVLDRVLEKISASEFFSPDARFDIYLADGPGEYRFFAPFVPGDYARVNPVNGGIFLAAADFVADRARPAPEAAGYLALSKVIAAAAAREMVRRRLAALTYLFMRDWSVTGYGERISGGPGQFTPADICAKDAPEGSALRDYEYGLAVELIMNEEKLSFADLLNKNYSYEGAERQLKKRYCGR
jgi:hypothetical protein